MTLSELKEIPLDHVNLGEFPRRDLTAYEQDIYNIDHRFAEFHGDYPHLTSKVTGCWEYEHLAIIIEIEHEKLYLYNVGETGLYEIRLFDEYSEPTDEQWNKTFGYILGETMWDRGMRRFDFAESIGVSEAMISKYIRGLASPSSRVLNRMARVLDCTVDELMPRDFYLVR